MNNLTAVPKILLIGGPDVDSRIPLIQKFNGQFEISVLGSNPRLASTFKDTGIRYFTYRMHRGSNPLADVFMLYQLDRIITSNHVDIVHTFDTKPSVWGRIAAWRARVPVIIGTLPGLGVLYSKNDLPTRVVQKIYQPLQKLACTLSDLTIFQNSHDADQFIQDQVVVREKTAMILGSGVETDIFNPQKYPPEKGNQVRASLGLDQSQVVVTMASRLIRSKGVLEFTLAAQAIRQKFPQVVFLLIGSDDYESLDSLIPEEQEFLANSVICLGHRNDIPELLAVSDIFVFPTYYREGIPRVLLEAASMALPIIATDTPGCTEIVQNNVNGFLVSKRDYATLVQAIERLIIDGSLRNQFGQHSRRMAVERFDISIISEQMASIYNRLLAQKQNGR